MNPSEINLTKEEVHEIVDKSKVCAVDDIRDDTEFPIQTDKEERYKYTTYLQFVFKREGDLYAFQVTCEDDYGISYDPVTAYKVEIVTVPRKELCMIE